MIQRKYYERSRFKAIKDQTRASHNPFGHLGVRKYPYAFGSFVKDRKNDSPLRSRWIFLRLFFKTFADGG